MFWEAISKTRKSSSPNKYPNTEKWVEKTKRSRVFLKKNFEMFEYPMKHFFECLI